MTPIEAAAQEAAAFYSQPAGDDSIALRRQQRLADELAVVDANARIAMQRDHSTLIADIRNGMPTSLLMTVHRVSYDVIHEARELANEVPA